MMGALLCPARLAVDVAHCDICGSSHVVANRLRTLSLHGGTRRREGFSSSYGPSLMGAFCGIGACFFLAGCFCAAGYKCCQGFRAVCCWVHAKGGCCCTLLLLANWWAVGQVKTGNSELRSATNREVIFQT